MPSFLFAIFLGAATGGAPVSAKLVDGRELAGELERWNDRGVTISSDGGPESLDVSELLSIKWSRTTLAAERARDSLTISFVDGSRIMSRDLSISGNSAAIEVGWSASPISVGRSQIRRIQLQPTVSGLEDLWKDLTNEEPGEDVLIVVKGKEPKLDYLTGILRKIDDEKVTFEWDGEAVDVKRAKVAGVGLYHRQGDTNAGVAWRLQLRDGSELSIIEAALSSSELAVKTTGGITLKIPVAEISEADFSKGKVTYLSDLKPIESAWTPQIGIPKTAQVALTQGQPHMDVSFANERLTLLWKDDHSPTRRDVRTYSKGLALRSRTEITYRIPEGARRFTGIAGIDPLTTQQGNVQLEILGDDQILWSNEIDGNRPPIAFDVELGAARRLQIRVDYGDNLDFGDRLHLVEARLTK